MVGDFCLSFANGLWVKEYLPIKPSFKEVVNTAYKADIKHVSFHDPQEVRLLFMRSSENQFVKAFDGFKVLKLRYA
ncbi:serpin-Z3-like [Malus domestica]|uniref:serpin-Z3-like n=1 Tax=Malus domestica TaxID=3750 RepID=UPI0010AA6303|nr:serpin-Z3-like [Malus domestica]